MIGKVTTLTAVALLLATEASFSEPHSSPDVVVSEVESLDGPLLASAHSPMVDCGDCWDTECWTEEHMFFAGPNSPGGGNSRAYDERDHECEEGFCSTAHPHISVCSSEELERTVDFTELSGLWTALTENREMDVARLVDKYPHRVLINHDRGAIQVLSCGGAISMSFPIGSALADSFRAN